MLERSLRSWHEAPQEQIYAGPWEKIRGPVTMRDMRERLPNGSLPAENLDLQYGAENVAFDTTQYDLENERERAAHMLEFDEATNAFNNALIGKGYTDENGQPTRAQRYVAEPPKGDILLSPDAKQ